MEMVLRRFAVKGGKQWNKGERGQERISSTSKVGESRSLSAEGNDPMGKEAWILELRGQSVAYYQGLRLGLRRGSLSPRCHWFESLAQSR